MKKKAQLNLDSFFKTNNARKQYFYIDWNSNNPRPVWLIKKPKNTSFSEVVNWYHIGDIIVCCHNRVNTIETEPQIKKSLSQINSKLFDENRQLLSFMKSHLQKCIRRQKSIEAIKSAKELLLIDKNELLRRICIIMFEDLHLKSYFSSLVWLMCACSKGYILEEYHLDYIFKCIYDMALDNQYEEYDAANTYDKLYVDKFIDEVNVNKKLTDEQKDMLYCIILRISYGGMGFDLDMLAFFARNYYKYFENNEKVLMGFDENLCKDINAKYVLGLKFEKIDDFLCQGVDFHCFPGIVKDIQEATSFKYADEKIKVCIWEYNSKINTRKDNSVDLKNYPNLNEVWEDIKTPLLKCQCSILTKMLEKVNVLESEIK